MAVPGFHAEVSAGRRSGPYAAGPPGAAGPGDLIGPAFTQEELDHIDECERAYKACDSSCPDPNEVPYEQWINCHGPCIQEWGSCMNPPPPPPPQE